MRARQIEIAWHSGLSIYASEKFLRLVGDEYGWLGGLDDSGKLLCILPYTIIRRPFIRMARFRVETISWGDGFAVEEEKKFLNSAAECLRSIGADMIIPATTNSIFRTYPDGADAAPYGTFIIDLRQSENLLWKNMHPNHRNKVSSAARKGVEIRDGIEHLDTTYELIRNSFKRSKIGFMGHGEYSRLIRGLGENVKLYVASYQGHVHGCLVLPYSICSAYALYSGRIPTAESGTMNLLRWEAIRQFREMGVQRFDSVGIRINPDKGSKQEGLKVFKQGFGGQLVQGYMWKYPIHRLKYAIYALAIRQLRGGDIVDRERHKLIKDELNN